MRLRPRLRLRCCAGWPSTGPRALRSASSPTFEPPSESHLFAPEFPGAALHPSWSQMEISRSFWDLFVLEH